VGESEVDQAAEVEGGGAVVEPVVVGGGAAVGQAAVAAGDEPGYGAFDHGPPAPVVVLPGGVGGGLVAGGGLRNIPGVVGGWSWIELFGFEMIGNFTHEFFKPRAITFDYASMNFYIASR
jgi:hypothetical protein